MTQSAKCDGRYFSDAFEMEQLQIFHFFTSIIVGIYISQFNCFLEIPNLC